MKFNEETKKYSEGFILHIKKDLLCDGLKLSKGYPTLTEEGIDHDYLARIVANSMGEKGYGLTRTEWEDGITGQGSVCADCYFQGKNGPEIQVIAGVACDGEDMHFSFYAEDENNNKVAKASTDFIDTLKDFTKSFLKDGALESEDLVLYDGSGSGLCYLYESETIFPTKSKVKNGFHLLSPKQQKLVTAIQDWAKENDIRNDKGFVLSFNSKSQRPQAALNALVKQAKAKGFGIRHGNVVGKDDR